ncbi:uncharacterized protein HMPREF1541_06021 [Cyphellophora europaea CBS 101466]|uniref:Man(5)GlcNAc(2)-PP-dolichol translocation protein RFT1 n=1 Tax=Cyphellophora europaea (strain CBS 101466) TaxID=1220924 RepID=W2RTZ7_CYPE1|nr:uncharacterized protein HMPREF1541_06021 [Cyphellophora europaea CBS 101466]ETN39795.1 hypothetical protein HMPREF1541_06021 [Cyphellophora europaea CBS 101466]
MSQPAGNTALLILTQVASRGLTFVGNQVILRYSAPTLLGIAVQLELVCVTVLYFGRESLRVALQRQPRIAPADSSNSKSKDAASIQLQGAINASYLAILLGILIGGSSFAYYLSIAPSEARASPNFSRAVKYYILATLVELLSEAFFVVIQQQALFAARAAAETRAAINRCIFACSVAFYTYRNGDEPSILPFATGQLAYGVTLFILYYLAAQRALAATNCTLLPSMIPRASNSRAFFSLFPRPLLSLATTLYAQSIFKLLLTQGDTLLLSLLAPLHSQGAFALASNYGGLLARLLFQPIEESSRNTFGALLSNPTPTAPSESNTRTALTHLALTLHTYTLGALLAAVLAPPLLPTLTPLALSPQWRTRETTSLLAAYVYYVPLTAVNGVLDAFVTSVATPAQLHWQSLSMAGFTALYGAAAWLFLNKMDVGAQGLVWANAVGMLARVAWGAWFVARWIADHGSRHPAAVVAADAAAATAERPPDDDDDNDAGEVVKVKARKASAEVSNAWFWPKALPDALSFVAAVGVWMGLRLTLPNAEGVRGGGGVLHLQHLSFVAMGGLVLGVSILLQEMEFLAEMLRTVVPRRIVERVPGLKEFLGGGQQSGVVGVERGSGGEGKKEL